jgi:hypothetical protein
MKYLLLAISIFIPFVAAAQTGGTFIRNDAGATLCGSASVPCAGAVDTYGRVLVGNWGQSGANLVKGADAADRTTAASVQYVAAAAGVRNYAATWGCVNTAAVASRVSLRCGTTDVASGYLVVTSGQFVQTLDPPARCAVNEAININIETGSTATRCFVTGMFSTN